MNNSTAVNLANGPNFGILLPQGCSLQQMWFLNFLQEEQLQTFFISSSQTIIITVLFPIIFTFGLIGNITFLLVVLLNKHMRTITNFYLSNLAVADILFIVVSAVIGFWRYAASGGISYAQTFKSTFGCLTSLALVYFTYLASMILVILVSFERYIAICHPLKYRSMKGSSKKGLSIKLTSLTWFVAICIAFIISPYQGRLVKKCIIWPFSDKYHNLPTVIYMCEPLHLVFKDVLALAQAAPFFIAVVVIVMLYSRIVFALRSHSAAMDNQQDQKQAGIRNVQKQVTRMVIANGLVYFLCLAPYQLIYIFDFLWRRMDHNLFENEWALNLLLVSRCMSAFNSAINPLIYALANPKYRRAFVRMVKCGKGNSVEPSSAFEVTDMSVAQLREQM